MTRVPFTHRMLAEAWAGHKKETRRVRPRPLVKGQLLLASCQFWRPMNEALHPGHYAKCQAAIQSHMQVEGAGKMPTIADLFARAGMKAVPAMLMPQWLCPLILEVEGTDEQRVQDVTYQQALAEGFKSRQEFLDYFQSLHPCLTLGATVQVVKFRAHRIEVAPSDYRPTVTPGEHWPEGWQANLPQVIQAQMVIRS